MRVLMLALGLQAVLVAGRAMDGGQGYNPGQGNNTGQNGGQGYNPGQNGGQNGGQGYNPGQNGGQGYNPGQNGGGGQGYNPGQNGGTGSNLGSNKRSRSNQFRTSIVFAADDEEPQQVPASSIHNFNPSIQTGLARTLPSRVQFGEPETAPRFLPLRPRESFQPAVQAPGAPAGAQALPGGLHLGQETSGPGFAIQPVSGGLSSVPIDHEIKLVAALSQKQLAGSERVTECGEAVLLEVERAGRQVVAGTNFLLQLRLRVRTGPGCREEEERTCRGVRLHRPLGCREADYAVCIQLIQQEDIQCEGPSTPGPRRPYVPGQDKGPLLRAPPAGSVPARQAGPARTLPSQILFTSQAGPGQTLPGQGRKAPYVPGMDKTPFLRGRLASAGQRDPEVFNPVIQAGPARSPPSQILFTSQAGPGQTLPGQGGKAAYVPGTDMTPFLRGRLAGAGQRDPEVFNPVIQAGPARTLPSQILFEDN